MADKEVITLGGRTFVHLGESTAQHDDWFMGRVREAGLDRVLLEIGEDPDQFARRILYQASGSGKVFEMIGALIVPEGMADASWTPEVALDTARFVGQLCDPEDKQRINNLTVTLLIGFFLGGLTSLETSKTSSTDAEPAPGNSTTSATDAGDPSSASSPGTTTSEPPG